MEQDLGAWDNWVDDWVPAAGELVVEEDAVLVHASAPA